MAGGVPVQFQTNARHITGGERSPPVSEFGILPPESYPDADTPGKITFINDIDKWLGEYIEAANSPHYDNPVMNYRATTDGNQVVLAAYDKVVDNLIEINRRSRTDHITSPYGSVNPPISKLYVMGVDIYERSLLTGDYGVYQKYLDYVNTSGAFASKDYEKWMLTKQAELSEAIINDPVLKSAKENWAQLSVDDKAKIAEHVHHLQVGIYGVRPDKIAKVHMPGKEDLIDDANRGDGEINLNLSSNIFNKSYEAFVGTVVHEGTHTLQARLIERSYQVLEIESNVLSQTMKLPGIQYLKTDEQRQQFQKLVHERIAKSGVSTPLDDRLGYFGDFSPHVLGLQLPYVPAGDNLNSYQRHPMEVEAFRTGSGMTRFLNASPEEQQRKLGITRLSLNADLITTNGPPDNFSPELGGDLHWGRLGLHLNN